MKGSLPRNAENSWLSLFPMHLVVSVTQEMEETGDSKISKPGPPAHRLQETRRTDRL